MSDVHIKFLFNKETVKKLLKWKDIKMIRRVSLNKGVDDEVLEKLQTLACRFMADENNQYIPFEQAFEIFDELSAEESTDAINKFVEVFQENTIPNAIGSRSETTSEASSPTPTSPNSQDGSTP